MAQVVFRRQGGFGALVETRKPAREIAVDLPGYELASR
jgi:hypothetical protein